MNESRTSPVLIIPAYQPASELIPLVASLRESDPSAPIVVVDDGSEASRKPIFETLTGMGGVTVLQHAVNLGKGAALKTAFNHALIRHDRASGVVTLDADGQHLPGDVERVKRSLVADSSAVHLGVRKFDGPVPLRSSFGNRLTRVIFKMITGASVTDTQTGLRGLPLPFLRNTMRIRSNGYEFETDMLIEAVTKGFPIREIPIKTVYIDDNKSSHFNPLRDSLKIYFVFARFLFTSVATAVIDFIAFSAARQFGVGLLGCSVTGRVFAGAFQFFVARTVVFRSGGSAAMQALRYVTLVIALMLISNLMIRTLAARSGMNVYAAKVLSETILFIVSFTVQRVIVFGSTAVAAAPEAEA